MKELHIWFKKNQRSFPWREKRTPYGVWISEVMLQQTRSSVVIPYYLRWMKQFPDVKTLGDASLEQVIKAWEGLGYYTRARNLLKGAREIVSLFDGEIPDSKEQLSAISGLGPYTIGAILNFGFHKKAAAVDGNVNRVMSRYFAISENICKASARRKIEEKTLAFLDEKKPWVTSEALIELGALVCLPEPRCKECPLQSRCLAFRQGIANALPIKNQEKSTTLLIRVVAVIEAQGSLLVQKGEIGKVMADLYEFPYFERKSAQPTVGDIGQMLGLELQFQRFFQEVTHTFTRYKARLLPYLLKAPAALPVKGKIWVDQSRIRELPFSAGHRKILNQMELKI